MKKNLKNIVSIGVLITILCVLIISVTTLSNANNLSTSQNENKTQINETTESTFNYVNSKTSLNKNVNFENNFGGSNNDQVYDVFKLNNYYIIGTSQSTNYYFNNVKQNSVFVLICDYLGNPIENFTYECSSNITYITSKVFKNSILILINSNGTKLLEYNLTENNFEVKYSNLNTANNLIVSNEPIVVYANSSQTLFTFVESNLTYTLPKKISSIVMACEYLNGTLVMFNFINGFEIALLTTNNLTTIKSFENQTLNNINITNKNFVLDVTSGTQQKILLLDLAFNLENELTINSSAKTKLMFLNNMHYLFYLNNNTLSLTLFCNHADKLLEVQIENNVKNYNILLLNNNFVVLSKKQDNSLSLQSVNIVGQTLSKTQIAINQNINIISATENNQSNIFIVGNFDSVNQIISNNYGKTDVFVCELKV